MVLDNWLAQRAETCPDRVALVADGIELTYADLEASASAVGRRLASRGARRGTTVALTLPAGVEYAVLLHGLMKVGSTAYPLNPRLPAPELERELEAAKPVLVVSERGQLSETEADLPLLGEHDLDSIHCRILTSGTAGEPRAIGLT